VHVVTIARDADLDALRQELPQADAILVMPRMNHVLRELWPYAKNVRWVHTLAAGVETLLFPELVASDVVVTNGRGAFANALAEFVVGAMLWFAKDIDRMRRNQHRHRWEPFDVVRIEEATVGIIGYGSIGRAVASRCEAFGMDVIAFRRGSLNLDELLTASDYIVICAPLTPSTRGLLGAPQLALMKESAVLINVGRGPIVDEAALIDALRERRIRGAALDVFDEEPLPPEHPFWSLDNVLLSPHCADHTADAHERAMDVFHDNLARFERGEELVNVVDKEKRY
jgi:phosphoglycerate dehydrogenase-like enzyme